MQSNYNVKYALSVLSIPSGALSPTKWTLSM